jgi:hypothetical protein
LANRQSSASITSKSWFKICARGRNSINFEPTRQIAAKQFAFKGQTAWIVSPTLNGGLPFTAYAESGRCDLLRAVQLLDSARAISFSSRLSS